MSPVEVRDSNGNLKPTDQVLTELHTRLRDTHQAESQNHQLTVDQRVNAIADAAFFARQIDKEHSEHPKTSSSKAHPFTKWAKSRRSR